MFSDSMVHNVDEACWMKDAWPVKAEAIGGRHYRGDNIDQNFDTYAVEYTFADGAKLFSTAATSPAASTTIPPRPPGRRGSPSFRSRATCPSYARTYKGMLVGDKDDKTLGDNPNLIWAYGKGKDEPNPYQMEWEDLVDAIIHDKPYNEVQRGTAGQPGHRDGPHGGPHRSGNHLRRNVQLRTRHGTRPRQADLDSPLPCWLWPTAPIRFRNPA